jgi:hypothetical protein
MKLRVALPVILLVQILLHSYSPAVVRRDWILELTTYTIPDDPLSALACLVNISS